MYKLFCLFINFFYEDNVLGKFDGFILVLFLIVKKLIFSLGGRGLSIEYNY